MAETTTEIYNEAPPVMTKDSPFMKAIHQGMREIGAADPATAPTPPPAAIAPADPVKPAPVPDKPATPPPVSTPPAEDDAPPTDLSPKANTAWQKHKLARESAEKRATEQQARADKAMTDYETAKKELEAARNGAPPEELARLKKERDEYETIVQQINVEAHPKFQAYFGAKLDGIKADVLAAAGDKANSIMEIIQQPDGERKREMLIQAMSELDPIAQQEVVAANASYRRMNQERQNEITKSKENYTKTVEDRKAQGERHQSEMKARQDALFKGKLTEFTDKEKGLPVFREIEGDAKWNAEVKQNLAAVEKLVTGQNKPEELLEAAFFAVHGMRSQRLLEASGAEIANLRKQIADLTAAAPKPPGGEKGQGNTPTPHPAVDPNTSWVSRTAGMIRGDIPLPPNQ